jgi:antitoxin component of MazEF toxin-antitoxin module
MEYNRFMIAMIRKSGNSFVIRVPREEMERLGVGPDEYVSVAIQPIDIRPRLPADLRQIADEVLAHPETAQALALLADA